MNIKHVKTTGDKDLSNNSSRRNFVKGAAAGWIFLQSTNAFGLSPSLTNKTLANKKLVWILLRGALDSLHTIVPISDPDLLSYRSSLLKPIQDRLLSLNKDYALHPSLSFLHELYKKQQMTPIIAVASGYRERSHFDAQDQMESGLNETDHESGWMARLTSQIQGNGVAISRSVPIALRSQYTRAETWFPSIFPEADEDLLARLSDLYESDEALSNNLKAVIAQKENPNMQMEEKKNAKFPYLAERCGELLSSNPNMQCAMLEMGGWDTHNNQHGRLTRLLSQLDEGIKKLKTSLGDTWDDTLLVVSTEFGRTVALNGTQGTDHGTGASMFLAGGALANIGETNSNLQGGKVHGLWPGLSKDKLFEQRDLMPTTDVRDWIGDAVSAHWDLSASQLKAVFPDTRAQ
jgi:uncharacterized protein (DUF1501 family)